MRDLIIVIVVIILVFVGGFLNEQYLKDTGESMVNKLTELEEQVEVVNMEKFEEIEKEWKNLKNMWYILTNHSNIDSIERDIERLKKYYEAGEVSHSLAIISELKAMFTNVSEIEKITITNIL